MIELKVFYFRQSKFNRYCIFCRSINNTYLLDSVDYAVQLDNVSILETAGCLRFSLPQYSVRDANIIPCYIPSGLLSISNYIQLFQINKKEIRQTTSILKHIRSHQGQKFQRKCPILKKSFLREFRHLCSEIKKTYILRCTVLKLFYFVISVNWLIFFLFS